MPLGERGLGVKGVHLAGPAVHEKKNAMLGLGGKMLRLGGKLPGKGAVARESIDEPQPCKACACLPKKLATRMAAGSVVRDEA